MSCYPQSATALGYVTYPVGPTADQTLVTSSGSANTKGTYVEFVASSPFACNAVRVMNGSVSPATRQYLFDVATGAGGAEVVKIPDLLSQALGTGGNTVGWDWTVPLAIPSGTRIAMRNASDVGSSGQRLSITLIAAGDCPGITSFVNYGANAADSGGTQVDPGGTINTKGAYSELTASSSAITQWLALMATLRLNTATIALKWAVDIATGAAASEVVLIPDIRVATNDVGDSNYPGCQEFLTFIAASTRLAVRASCTSNDATDRLFDAALLAGTAPSEPATGTGPHYPQNATQRSYITYPIGSGADNSRGKVLAASGSANTKGAYGEYVASSPFACNYVIVEIQMPELATAGIQNLCDIATGAGGAEVVRLPDMMSANGGGFYASATVQAPLAIPASTRIAGRTQSSTGGSDNVVGLTLIAAGNTPGVTTCVNYGSNTADSGGQQIDPGGTIDTKGSYAQITASTSAIIQWLAMMFTLGGNTGPQAAIWGLDLATGAGGAEVILIPDLKLSAAMTAAAAMRSTNFEFLTYIDASTRLAARAACNINDATDRLFDIGLLTATAPAESAGGGGGSFPFVG